MLKRCKNGHVTGYRNCSVCATKDVHPEPGQGFVLSSKHELHIAERQRQLKRKQESE
jgi:hypothetical protein